MPPEERKEKARIRVAEWRKKNPERFKAALRKWHLNNIEKHRRNASDWQKAHPKEARERQRKWVKENPERAKAHSIRYREKNKDAINARTMEWARKKYRTDPVFKLTISLRTRFYKAIIRNSKTGSVLELLGCSVAYLKKYLERKFQDGMTWGNYGKWHIDHIQPCASFDLSRPEEQRQCFHYSNLQPLWAKDNLKKSCN